DLVFLAYVGMERHAIGPVFPGDPLLRPAEIDGEHLAALAQEHVHAGPADALPRARYHCNLAFQHADSGQCPVRRRFSPGPLAGRAPHAYRPCILSTDTSTTWINREPK